MYQTDLAEQLRVRQSSEPRPRDLKISPTVWKLGFTSLLTDASAEMVQSVLPLYLFLYLHFSPLQFGVLDGIAQGGAVALLSLASGIYADRYRRQKLVATTGYLLSAVSRIGLLAAGSAWTVVAGMLAIDRLGKGIRTAPRDAMLSLSSDRRRLATAFSVHRALDAGGAVLGPLLAYLLLRLVPDAFGFVLMTSFWIALLGVGVIALLVPKPLGIKVSESLHEPIIRMASRTWNEPFRGLVIAASILGLVTASDSFIYLLLRENTHASSTAIPLYAFLTALFYLIFSIPAGQLADRWGRPNVFLAGYLVLGATYGLLLWSPGALYTQFVVVALLGMYYAATDGVLAAMASAHLNSTMRTSGLAVLNTASSCARLLSSFVFGLLWSFAGMKPALWSFFSGLVVSIIVSVFVVGRGKKSELVAAE